MVVIMVVVGIGVCTVTDVQINSRGSLCACVAVLATSLQQISIGSLQKKYSIGSFELLSQTVPIQALSLLLLGSFVDYFLRGKFLADYKISPAAFVLGHMKTVCVLILGWLLFGSEMTPKNILGMSIAVIGMIIYSGAVEADKSANSKALQYRKDSSTEDVKLLLKQVDGSSLLQDVELGKAQG